MRYSLQSPDQLDRGRGFEGRGTRGPRFSFVLNGSFGKENWTCTG